MPHPRAVPVTLVGVLLLWLLLLWAASGCTGHRTSTPPPRPSASSAGRPAPLTPPSAPQRTSVTHVAGSLGTAGRARLARHVGRTISSYVDAAFLSGRYPRTDFSSSFEAFTPGARVDARRDGDLLTNRSLGPSTASVRATRRTAYLSVLAAKGQPTGVTAAVDVELTVDRGRRPSRQVHLAGRLLLTQTAPGRWAIFGYDLRRSDAQAGRAS